MLTITETLITVTYEDSDGTTDFVGDGMFKFAKDNTGNSTDVGFYGKLVQEQVQDFVGGMHWDGTETLNYLMDYL